MAYWPMNRLPATILPPWITVAYALDVRFAAILRADLAKVDAERVARFIQWYFINTKGRKYD